MYTINTLLELQANSLCESKIQKLSSMKKSLSLLSCYLVFIVYHISSLSLDIIYISFNGLTKLLLKHEKKIYLPDLKGYYFLIWGSLYIELTKILFEERR